MKKLFYGGLILLARIDGTFYPNESAYIAMRDEKGDGRAVAIFTAIGLLVVGLGLAFRLVPRQ